jgi:hypothetical protein
LFAVLTPEQREKLLARAAETDTPLYVRVLLVDASPPHQLAQKLPPPPLSFTFYSRGFVTLSAYGQLHDPELRETLSITTEQVARLNSLQAETEAAVQKIFDRYEPPTEPAKAWHAAQLKKQDEYRRTLEQFGKEVVAKIEAILQPQQIAALRERRIENAAAGMLSGHVRAALEAIHVTPEQSARLWEIYSDITKPNLDWERAEGAKALAILTAEQRKKLGYKWDVESPASSDKSTSAEKASDSTVASEQRANARAEVKSAIDLLEQPWQTNITDEELDKAAEKLKPAADEAVDAIMKAFNRNDQAFAYRHRAVQLLQRLGTPKARATLLDIALGRSAEDLSSMKAWASAHYLRITRDPAGVRKLLASDDADVLGNALRALKGKEIDEDLLKRLVELTAYKAKDSSSTAWTRVLAADVMAADPSDRAAAQKVAAILAAVDDQANMPDANNVQKLHIGTNAETCYYSFIRALAEMRGADDALRQAAGRSSPLGRDIVAIARAERGDAAARPDLRRILEDPKADLRRAWAAQALAKVGNKDDLPLLKKLADSDPMERLDMRSDVGSSHNYFPVREAARLAVKQIESSRTHGTTGGSSIQK